MRLRNRSTDPLMVKGCDGWLNTTGALNPYKNTTDSNQVLRVWVNRVTGLAADGNTFTCRATGDKPLSASTEDSNVSVDTGQADTYAIRRLDGGSYAPGLVIQQGGSATVTERCALPNREADIALLVGCVCFTALTAPYAGGGGILPSLRHSIRSLMLAVVA